MNHLSRPALTFDEMMAQGEPAVEYVPLCLNGKLVKQYEEVTARIADRAALADLAAQEAAAPAADDPDARLAGAPAPTAPSPAGTPDPEQEEADRLRTEMKRFTQVFTIHSLGAAYNELIEQHPPRADKFDSKKVDTRDLEGFNSGTFYPALIRASITEPKMNDARWEKLMRGPARISDAQLDRLAHAAVLVNRRDQNLPFSLDDSGNLQP